MDARSKGEKILRDLDYDFKAFTIDTFIARVSKVKGRRIRTTAWDMPPGLFGAWLIDGDEQVDYIFYRQNVPPIHQIHIQLHELAHILSDHPTLQVRCDPMGVVIMSENDLPRGRRIRQFMERSDEIEQEAEVLVGLIQSQIIRYSQLDRLTCGISSSKTIASSMDGLGLL
jgi:hypothetical protein